MEKITKTYEIYDYNELSENAKEKVKNYYLTSGIRNDLFQENIKYKLNYYFKNSSLDYQYSLDSCQGDGVNIYGKINVDDIFDTFVSKELDVFLRRNIIPQIKMHIPSKEMLAEFKDFVKENDISIIIPYNDNYTYSLAHALYFDGDIYDGINLDNDKNNFSNDMLLCVEDIRIFLIEYIDAFNNYYKKLGYNFLYNISDEDMEECCIANEWKFLRNGDFFE